MNSITCCKDCARRELGCHSACEVYAEERRRLDSQPKEKSDGSLELLIAGARRMKRRKGIK